MSDSNETLMHQGPALPFSAGAAHATIASYERYVLTVFRGSACRDRHRDGVLQELELHDGYTRNASWGSRPNETHALSRDPCPDPRAPSGSARCAPSFPKPFKTCASSAIQTEHGDASI